MIHGSSIDAVSLFHPIASSKEVNRVVAAAKSAYELTSHKCTLGCPLLDRLLDGGVPCRSVTEISSESAAGKTQLCLQLLLSAQLSAAVLFVHSEFPFPARRLRQLAAAAHSQLTDPLDHVFVAAAHTPDDLPTLLDRLHASSPSGAPAHSLPSSPSGAPAPRRQHRPAPRRRLRRRAFPVGVRQLPRRAPAAVLAFLQNRGEAQAVRRKVRSCGGGDQPSCRRRRWLRRRRRRWYEGRQLRGPYSSGRRVCPALGLSWANCMNTRLFLSRREVAVDDMDDSPTAAVAAPARTRRRMLVVFAPHLPGAACEFEITREGVFGIKT